MQRTKPNRSKINPASWFGGGVRASSIYCLLFCVIPTAAAFAADSAQKTFSLTISQGTLPAQQRVLRVEKDDIVRLRERIIRLKDGRLEDELYRESA